MPNEATQVLRSRKLEFKVKHSKRKAVKHSKIYATMFLIQYQLKRTHMRNGCDGLQLKLITKATNWTFKQERGYWCKICESSTESIL